MHGTQRAGAGRSIKTPTNVVAAVIDQFANAPGTCLRGDVNDRRSALIHRVTSHNATAGRRDTLDNALFLCAQQEFLDQLEVARARVFRLSARCRFPSFDRTPRNRLGSRSV